MRTGKIKALERNLQAHLTAEPPQYMIISYIFQYIALYKRRPAGHRRDPELYRGGGSKVQGADEPERMGVLAWLHDSVAYQANLLSGRTGDLPEDA